MHGDPFTCGSDSRYSSAFVTPALSEGDPMRVLWSVTLATLMLAAPAAHAQLSPQLGLRAGISMPISDLEASYESGYNLGVSLGLKPLLSPVGIRFEAAFNQFGGKTGVIPDLRIFEGTANLLLDLFPMPTLSLYAIGGGGLYNSKAGNSSSNKGGVNVGGGLRFGLAGFNAHVEARFHHIFVDRGNSRYLPITAGISF
jgi:hypothetical protein